MLTPERQQQILELVEAKGAVRTVDLAEQFGVTDETIRRDLQALENAGHINRVHGGAVSLTARPKLQSFSERRVVEVERKRAIARAALELVQPGEVLAFDSSTTAFELVCLLPDQPGRVITNAHPVLHQLVDAQHLQLVCTGGRYHATTRSYNGVDAIALLRKHHIQKAIISCVGLDLEHGASEGFEQQAVFKEALVQHADEVILLCDATKLEHRSEYFFCPLERVTHLITDAGASAGFVGKLRDAGVDVTLA
ncbi:MAG: DeoR/GlpR family DNA-binding transcription regulator [Opitutales bacterium]